MRLSHFNAVAIIAVVAILLAGPVVAQQPAPGAMWQLAPADSLLVVGFDGRPDNPSMIALAKSRDPAMQDQIARQQAAMRKAIEDFATLFGISLDFVKDIDSWTGEQWLLVVVRDGEKNEPIPVFLLASKDADAANAALLKLLAPFERIGEVTTEPGIIAFKTTDKSVEVYASASGPVVAFSPSKTTLQKALGQSGPAAGSIAGKALTALSGSMFYAFADPALFEVKPSEVPLTGISMGVSVTDTGVKVRARGYLTDDAKGLVKQAIASKAGVRTANPAIPSTALVTASMPNFSAIAGMVSLFGGINPGGPMPPELELLTALDQTQVSAALTAVLPLPSGAVAAMADSDQAAAEKLTKIIAALKTIGIPTKQAGDVTQVVVSDDLTLNIAQSGPYIIAATDKGSLAGVNTAIKTTGLAQSETYKETIAGLGDSNMLTLYANLAPIQGLGYLADALGISQISPIYAMAAKGLQDVHAMGLGVGFDGDVVDATVFMRGKPQIMLGIGAAMIPVVAISAAIMLPAFSHAREVSGVTECEHNVKQLGLCALTYAQYHNGKLPTSSKWKTQVQEYGVRLACPTGNAIYAFNKNLGGVNPDKVENQSDLIMFFEADPGLPNATGSRANAILPHDGRGVFGYADGHVKLESSVPDQSHWVPKYAPTKPAKKAPVRPRRH